MPIVLELKDEDEDVDEETGEQATRHGTPVRHVILRMRASEVTLGVQNQAVDIHEDVIAVFK